MMPAMDPQRSLRGELLLDEPLANHTTWRVGGPARRFYRPADRDDLLLFLSQLDADEPLLWLGLGSNLLVRDGGFAGTVIATQGRLDRIEWRDHRRLYAEAGVSCAKVARTAARAGLCGVEFLAGIPGTLGGALAMNAGAFGGETWQRVVEVETLDHRGGVHVRQPAAFEIGYRQVKGPAGEWFLSALLQLQPGDSEAAQREIRQLLERRSASQPTRQPSCGSVFRNPPGDHAARLIEAAGLKGLRLGGAQVSEKHANFIINTGNASAAQIEALIEQVRERVEAHSGIRLIPEVHRVGEPA
jgi:UDP-N-acetylmuramate dehydrogenase